ncbi:unnamed protein product, partial [marine sediment metagenome]
MSEIKNVNEYRGKMDKNIKKYVLKTNKKIDV